MIDLTPEIAIVDRALLILNKESLSAKDFLIAHGFLGDICLRYKLYCPEHHHHSEYSRDSIEGLKLLAVNMMVDFLRVTEASPFDNFEDAPLSKDLRGMPTTQNDINRLERAIVILNTPTVTEKLFAGALGLVADVCIRHTKYAVELDCYKLFSVSTVDGLKSLAEKMLEQIREL